jgi:hypothetical protein
MTISFAAEVRALTSIYSLFLSGHQQQSEEKGCKEEFLVGWKSHINALQPKAQSTALNWQ